MDPDRAQALRDEHYNATIIWSHRIHDDLIIIRVRPDGEIPSYKPGQYAALGLGYWEPRLPDTQPEEIDEAKRTKLVRRAFSISCPILTDDGKQLMEPADETYLELYIALVRDNGPEQAAPAFTPRMFMKQPGDRVWLGPKITGHYTADDVDPGHDVLFCGTGTGEAPHNRMVWDMLRHGHRGQLVTVTCCRFRNDLAYLDVHARLEQMFPNYAYVPLTTRDTDGPKMYIQDLLLTGTLVAYTGIQLDPSRTRVFLCGNPSMIGIPTERDGRTLYPSPRGLIEILETRFGFRADRRGSSGNIHYEKYW